VSNGEYVPPPMTPRIAEIQRRAHEIAEATAKRLGVSRRDFLHTAGGSAACLLAINSLGCGGGKYNVAPEAPLEPAVAEDKLTGDELIFDVQTHHVSVERKWWEAKEPTLGDFLKTTPQGQCGMPTWAECFARDAFIKEVFFDSDTRLGVVSALWGSPDINAIHEDEMMITRERLDLMGAPRLRTHAHVQPVGQPIAKVKERMQSLFETWKPAAWKLYPVWGPDGKGYRLDQGPGSDVIAHGIALGQPLFAVHKGLPLPGMEPGHSSPIDVGPAAKAFPEATFLIYHSGIEPDQTQWTYDKTATRGVDALIRSLEENGIGKDGNVYAELGSAWRMVMGDPDQAAHLLGKLLKHLGEDRILWGTDCIWYGSPQDQIQAFRAFEIGEKLQESHGYPALTPQAKRKIFGLNAARVYGVDAAEMKRATDWDPAAKAKEAYLENPSPSHRTYGPKNRRELLSLLRHHPH
jgi:hypothetical protein